MASSKTSSTGSKPSAEQIAAQLGATSKLLYEQQVAITKFLHTVPTALSMRRRDQEEIRALVAELDFWADALVQSAGKRHNTEPGRSAAKTAKVVDEQVKGTKAAPKGKAAAKPANGKSNGKAARDAAKAAVRATPKPAASKPAKARDQRREPRQGQGRHRHRDARRQPQGRQARRGVGEQAEHRQGPVVIQSTRVRPANWRAYCPFPTTTNRKQRGT